LKPKGDKHDEGENYPHIKDTKAHP
jgi:hypothetical protein